eukprot:TRINITY_DN636_c0_g1_i1.p1 TRINITY_DN636_c0_g1~~TRINITY_DN636_c0_g1_i1.p1  ORF type:complete len:145 (-),score=15.39 TRINITY_DN636_c0_g1_i1:786-1220(-)
MAESSINSLFACTLPPDLEEAGLEDPALSVEGIMEAFARAAAASSAPPGESDSSEDPRIYTHQFSPRSIPGGSIGSELGDIKSEDPQGEYHSDGAISREQAPQQAANEDLLPAADAEHGTAGPGVPGEICKGSPVDTPWRLAQI